MIKYLKKAFVRRALVFDIVWVELRRWPTTIIAKLKFIWWGVKGAKSLSVKGQIHVRVNANSRIFIGKNCRFNSYVNSNWIGVNRRCMLSTHWSGSEIIIGDNCGFSGTVIGGFKSITLGKNVMCAANTLITDSDWHNNDPRIGPPSPISIGDNVWLGEGVKVLKGVTIGANTIVGAGSVVVKDLPANVIAAGNPCKVIKNLDD